MTGDPGGREVRHPHPVWAAHPASSGAAAAPLPARTGRTAGAQAATRGTASDGPKHVCAPGNRKSGSFLRVFFASDSGAPQPRRSCALPLITEESPEMLRDPRVEHIGQEDQEVAGSELSVGWWIDMNILASLILEIDIPHKKYRVS